MAETLGSLVDKLTIKKIRSLHLEKAKTSPKIKRAQEIVRQQITDLVLEIDDFLKKALKGNVVLREQKVKLYNNPPSHLKLNKTRSLGRLVALLSQINKELWDLEDQVRVKGIPYKRVAYCKKQIDLSNKNRNDTIDRIDEFLEQRIKKCRK
ncbi:MAG: DUF4254 domain-containing protein [Candidatus Saganbacteria bacterium]|nr:DUF4254 domain-containing protein [Candidatus Saganbacteria bacterium]